MTLLILVLGLVIVGCGDDEGQYDVILVTDHGPVNDNSFNQGSWEGVEAYGKDHKIKYHYLRPSENSAAGRMAAIDLAAESGAKVIVTPGFSFAGPIFEAQTKYPNIKFILLDATPSKDGQTNIAENTISIFYDEAQSGFLLGYAAVHDGFRNLGYMGGAGVPAVIRFGSGFIQGAEKAANELTLEDNSVKVKYTHLGGFQPNTEFNVMATSWYNDDVELIFCAAGTAINNIITAAESHPSGQKWVMGANVPQNHLSEKIISSGLKQLKNSVYQQLELYYKGKFVGGKSITLDASNAGVGITDDFSRFKTFTKAKYEEMFGKLANGTVTVNTSGEISVLTQLGLKKVVVDNQL